MWFFNYENPAVDCHLGAVSTPGSSCKAEVRLLQESSAQRSQLSVAYNKHCTLYFQAWEFCWDLYTNKGATFPMAYITYDKEQSAEGEILCGTMENNGQKVLLLSWPVKSGHGQQAPWEPRAGGCSRQLITAASLSPLSWEKGSWWKAIKIKRRSHTWNVSSNWIMS